jgi:hypothetical protein
MESRDSRDREKPAKPLACAGGPESRPLPVGVPPGATIAFMAKFKPAKAKKRTAPAPQGAIPCVILVIAAIAAVMLLLFFVMKSSSGS